MGRHGSASFRRRQVEVVVEHWVAAERQGQIAAANMLGPDAPIDEAPFFWSAHYDVSIRYVGHAERWDRIEVDGDIAGGDATVRYFGGETLLAAATIGRDMEAPTIDEALRGRSRRRMAGAG